MKIHTIEVNGIPTEIMYRMVRWQRVLDVFIDDVMISVRKYDFVTTAKYIAETAPGGIMPFSGGFLFNTMKELLDEIVSSVKPEQYDAIEIIFNEKYEGYSSLLEELEEMVGDGEDQP